MLAYVKSDARGALDALLSGVASQLSASGVAVCGAVQINEQRSGGVKSHMDLHLYPTGEHVRISQDLGSQATGCRLDPDGLEHAVARVEALLAEGADILIVNKFGKQEASGHGFRSIIGEAIAAGIPVLCGIGGDALAAFEDFASGLADPVPANAAAVLEWAQSATHK
ncbi:DUF2478 domain-containing protein [Celeribacter arenosi]|uniref:DUF2478 domain-containing protein n=1 Tax=Celeribacter arenosi TaxID=792649 RepID=A0ABP7K5E8_9RHOB